MVNMTELVYFQDLRDLENLEKLTFRWTPLETKRMTKNINGTEYPVLEVFYDKAQGLHGWSPNEDWTFPSATEAAKQGYKQPEFFRDILPDWEKKFEFERFDEPRKTQKEIEEEKRLECEFKDMEKTAISNAIKYIIDCGNKTIGGYKECIRDAFIPLINKFAPKQPEKAIQSYKVELLKFLEDRKFPVVNEVNVGIDSGLYSVFIKKGW